MNEELRSGDAYYVGVQGAVALRRHILETAKVTVQTVKTHERIQGIYEEKLRLRSNLVEVLDNLRKDLTTLRTKLPKRDLPPMRVPAPPVAAPAKKLAEHKLDKIEAALAEIEARMKTI